LWHGTAESWEDLSTALTGEWPSAHARSVWTNGTTLYVAGDGFSFRTGSWYQEALLWARSLGGCGTADFNGDGDVATDADIEAFFACLAGTCCAVCGSADFNGDGDVATDADIEAFFRVLAGGTC
jgi:hypothetical protein